MYIIDVILWNENKRFYRLLLNYILLYITQLLKNYTTTTNKIVLPIYKSNNKKISQEIFDH